MSVQYHGQLDPDSRMVKPTENLFDAKSIDCPVCPAVIGQQCYKTVDKIAGQFDVFEDTPRPNHVLRAKQARWKKMNLFFDIQ